MHTVRAGAAVDGDRTGGGGTWADPGAPPTCHYVGWAALHVGIGLITGSGWVLATLPAAGAAIQRQVRREEAAHAATFGPAFDAYRERVPRYLPGPPRVGLT